jgi:hypothetical protein
MSTYLALGDSMSIDDYTGVVGGGAVAQFFKRLEGPWTLKDLTLDGCTIPEVPRHHLGDLITLTIGGNDALTRLDEIKSAGLDSLLHDHLRLLQDLRGSNPDACLIVGNIYAPQTPLPDALTQLLEELNAGIAENIAEVGGRLADIRAAFRGHEHDYLCQEIEPTLAGATAIADLFERAYN